MSGSGPRYWRKPWKQGFLAFLVSVQVPAGSGERRDGIAADAGGEGVGEVGEERAPLQAAGDGDGEEPFDGAFALLGLAAV